MKTDGQELQRLINATVLWKGNYNAISRYSLVLFQRVSCITTKHNCVGDQNVILNKHTGVAAMEDGGER
jgi:hypothetical protein